jgi:hypothetical protein
VPTPAPGSVLSLCLSSPCCGSIWAEDERHIAAPTAPGVAREADIGLLHRQHFGGHKHLVHSIRPERRSRWPLGHPSVRGVRAADAAVVAHLRSEDLDA